MGSFLVKVRFLLGLAWLMGMVEPWKSMVGGLSVGSASPVSLPFTLGSQPAPGAQGRARFCLCPDTPHYPEG